MRPTQNRRGIRLITCLALAIPACSEHAPPLLQRLVLQPQADRPIPSTTPVETVHQLVLAELPAWTIEAPGYDIVPLASTPRRKQLLVVAGRPEQTLRLTRQMILHPAETLQLRVTLTFQGRGVLIGEFLRDGNVHGRARPITLQVSDEPYDVIIPVPKLNANAPPFDALVLKCEGTYRQFGLLSLGATPYQPWKDLPNPHHGPSLVSVGSDARRALTVFPGVPLIGEVDVSPGSVLSLAYASPASGSSERSPPLSLTLDDGSMTPAEFRYPLVSEQTPRWHRIVLPLKRWEGARLSVRLSVPQDMPIEFSAVVTTPEITQPAVAPPRVLLVTTDTHRGDHVGATQQGVDVHTPALDALAERGTLFSDCWSTTNITNPSHVALMTGVHPQEAGILGNRTPLVDSAPTLPERFAAAGWSTIAVIAAPHLGHEVSGLGQGFDRIDWPRESQRPGLASREILSEWIGELDDRPLFVWWHVFDAHTPYDPPDAVAALYYDMRRDPFDAALPEPLLERALSIAGVEGVRDLEWPRALYRAEVNELDTIVSPLLSNENDLVAVVGDHGEGLAWGDLHFGHAELRRSTLHVPLILAGRGVPAGHRIEAPVTTLDLGRTLLDLAGLVESEFPGRNLFSSTAAARESRYQIGANGCSASVNLGRWLLVLHLISHQPPQAAQALAAHQLSLFDLTEDPHAPMDVVSEHPEVATQLGRSLVDWLQQGESRNWSGEAREGQALQDQLRQLGYVSGATGDRALFEDDGCEWCVRFLRTPP